jgi:hypothetical protein
MALALYSITSPARRRVVAGHLDDEGGLDLVPRLGGLDESQTSIHSNLRYMPGLATGPPQ